MSETAEIPQVSGNMFLFERPELINKEQHGGLGFSQPEQRFRFCSKVRAIPITVSEISAAMKDYPIIIASKEQILPLAVVGLIDDVNLFIDENGDWEPHRYIPGYVRRYPFGVANETGGERSAVVIDGAYEGLTQGGDTPLFENDELSSATKLAIEFCQTYERDRQVTNEFANQLAPYDLVQGQSAQFTPQGASEPKTFAEYFGFDEARLKALGDEQVLALHKSGMLAIVHAMIMSMGNWRMLLERRAKRFNLAEADLLTPAIN